MNTRFSPTPCTDDPGVGLPCPPRRGLERAAFAGLLAVFLTGCAGVEPYERENLATYGMRPDRDLLAGRLQDHLWFSREAANGGGRVGGGGCGCN